TKVRTAITHVSRSMMAVCLSVASWFFSMTARSRSVASLPDNWPRGIPPFAIAPYPVARSQRHRSGHDIARHLLMDAGIGAAQGGARSRHEAGIFAEGDSKRM